MQDNQQFMQKYWVFFPPTKLVMQSQNILGSPGRLSSYSQRSSGILMSCKASLADSFAMLSKYLTLR